MKEPFRIGYGYDVHQFEYNRPLILGGINIPYDKGLKGHSDADVLLHAICDALLGSLSLGDIGKHFPDTDPAYKNVDSRVLLKETYKLIIEQGYTLANVDSTLVIERPKIAPHIDKIKSEIAGLLNCREDQVSIKATTSEKLGFVGQEEGVKAYAVVLIYKQEE